MGGSVRWEGEVGGRVRWEGEVGGSVMGRVGGK